VSRKSDPPEETNGHSRVQLFLPSGTQKMWMKLYLVYFAVSADTWRFCSRARWSKKLSKKGPDKTNERKAELEIMQRLCALEKRE